MSSTIVWAAVPQAPIQAAAEGSWLGNAGSATIAIVFLWGGYYMAKHQMLLWGPFLQSKMTNVKWDWKSIMSFLFGFWGVTSLIGSSGIGGVVTGWLQGIVTWFGGTGIGAAVGAAGVCFVLTLIALRQALKNKDDSVADIKWGAGLAIVYPLGGGPFLWISATVANALVELLNGIPAATT